MSRAIIQKPILDTLIRAKLANVQGCHEVEPLPVAWTPDPANGCNWTVPGWVGDSASVRYCVEKLGPYLALLQAQFNIPDEWPGRTH